METYPPWEIYQNMPKFFKYRGLELDHDMKDVDSFKADLNRFGFIGMNDKARSLFIVLLVQGSSAAMHTSEFKRIFAKIPLGNDKNNKDVIIISEEALTTSVKKAIDKELLDQPGLSVENHLYHIFEVCIPEHQQSSQHRILSQDEVTQMKYDLSVSKNQIPHIRQMDPQCIWIGAKVGDVVAIESISENAVTQIYARIVVPGELTMKQPKTKAKK